MTHEFKQAYVLTMETGAIALCVVMGEDEKHGEGLAHSAAQEALDAQVWDCCNAPYSGKWDIPEGVTILRSAGLRNE